MAKPIVVYETTPESPECYTELRIDVLDGNGEYINDMKLVVQGKITFVSLAADGQRGPALSGREG